MMWIVLGVGLFIALVIASSNAEEVENRSWGELRQTLGLITIDDGLKGVFQGRTVKINKSDEEWDGASGVESIVTTAKLPVILTAENVWTKTVRNPDHQTGDFRFDNKVRIKGDPRTLTALLDRQTRALVLQAIEDGMSIGPKVRLDEERDVHDQAAITEILSRQSAIVKALTKSPTTERLEEIALDPREPNPVRANAMGFLVDGATEGWLTEVLENPHNPDEVRAIALQGLWKQGIRPLGLEALSERSNALGWAAYQILTEKGQVTRLAIQRRLEGFNEELHAGVQAAVAHGGFEEALIDRLSTELDCEDAVYVIIGLESIGSKRSLAVLEPLSKGTWSNPRIKSAAQAAMGAIRQRLGGDHGGLSLPEQGGELDVADS